MCKSVRCLLVSTVAFLALGTASATASNMTSQALSDSLTRMAAGFYEAEPTIQQILDELGYNVSAVTDELSLSSICTTPGPVSVRILAEYSGFANQARVLWYPPGVPQDTIEILPGAAAAGDSSIFQLSSSADLSWLYTPRSGTRWYSETAYNYDQRRHIRVYPGPHTNSYIMFWEDLAWLADGDFNDMVTLITLPPVGPQVKASATIADSVFVPGMTVCVDVDVLIDDCRPEAVTLTMVEGRGSFPAQSSSSSFSAQHCFQPPSEGIYSLVFDVSSTSGATTRDTINLVLTNPSSTQQPELDIIITSDNRDRICRPGAVCIPFSISSICPIQSLWAGSAASINTDDSTLCVEVSNSTEFCVPFVVEDECGNKDSVSVCFLIDAFEPTVLNCPATLDAVLCFPGFVTVPVSVSGGAEPITISAVPPAVYSNGQTFLNVEESGVYDVYTIVENATCPPETCHTSVTAEMNRAPSVQGLPDTIITVCRDGQFCFGPIDCIDPDGNLNTCLIWEGPGSFSNGTWCYIPPREELVEVVFRAGDDCQRSGFDTLRVHFVNPSAPIITFENETFDLCQPEEVCIPFSVSNSNGLPLTLSLDGPGTLDLVDSVVCVSITETASFNLILSAEGPCGGSSSESATVNAVMNTPPVVTCVPAQSGLYCPGDPVCFGYTISDPGDAPASVSISGFGSVQNRQVPLDGDNSVCFNASQSGEFTVRIIATDDCGAADTCETDVTIELNSAPTVSASDTSVFLCGPEDICVEIACNDPDGNLATCVVEGSAGGFYSGGSFCFTPDTAGTYTVTATATDDCGAQSAQTAYVTVDYNTAPSIAVSGSLTRDAVAGDTVCFDFNVFDLDDNVIGIVALDNVLSYDDSTVCIRAVALSVVCARVIVTDACGLSDTVTVCVSAGPGPNPQPVPDLPDTIWTSFCGPADVCVPFTVDESSCEPQVLTSTGGGVVDLFSSSVCLYIDTPGTYETGVIAADTCGAGTSYVVIIAEASQPPQIVCPSSENLFICGDTLICRTVSYSDLEDNVAGASASFGTASSPQGGEIEICLPIDTAGTYRSEVIVTDSCGGADTCTFVLSIIVNRPPVIGTPSDQSLTICAGGEVCVPIDCTDPDGNLVACGPVDLGDAAWDGEDLCFAASVAGVYQWVFKAEDDCGATDFDTVRVEVALNTAPVVSIEPAHLIELCEPDSFCISYAVSDAENNVATVTTTAGVIRDGQVCVFLSGVFTCFDVTVTDSCGLSHTKSVCVTRLAPDSPSILTPDTLHRRLCSQDDICFDIDLGPVGETWAIDISPIGALSPDSQSICFAPDTAGMYVLVATVTNPCGESATDTTIVFVEYNAPPILGGPENVTLTDCGDGPVCFNALTFSDPDGNIFRLVVDSGNGEINTETGEICFDPATAGTYCFRVLIEDSCGLTAIKRICAVTSNNVAPSVSVEDIADVGYATGPVSLCFDITLSDPNFSQTVSLSKLEGAGQFTGRTGNTVIIATHCFLADTAGCYRFVFEASDDCGLTARDTMMVCVNIDPPDTTFQICIDTVFALNDRVATVKVRTNQVQEMGGLDLLICFDPTALTLTRAFADTALQEWEYFTYRVGDAAACPPCVEGQVRIVGIADMDNGPTVHPSEQAFLPRGPLAGLEFYVTPDRSFIGQCIPLSFCSFDCGDNSISSRTGDTLFIARDGVPDTCVVGKARPVVRRIDFCEGRLCIIPPPDDRGDMNLNGIASEIGDAVFYSTFFIYGDVVFHPVYRENQILASDVNCDGIVLTVADLIYMIRIVTGDESSTDCPDVSTGGKIVPYVEAGRVSMERNGDELEVWVETDSDIGGVFVRMAGKGRQGANLTWGPATNQLKREAKQTSHGLRILLTAQNSDSRIPGGRQKLFSITSDGSENWQLVESQAATTEAAGIYMEMVNSKTAIPGEFAILPNYPNPFNAGTQIRFSLGAASSWSLIIYNVLGQPVREFEGDSEAGVVSIQWDAKALSGKALASGVYFARVKVGDISKTRQMVLLK